MEPAHAGANRRLQAVGCVLVVLGLSVLAGWVWGVVALQAVLLSGPSMEPSVAFGFLCLGGTCATLGMASPPRALCMFTLGLTLLVGAAALFQTWLDEGLGVRQALSLEPGCAGLGACPGRMAPGTALAFVLLASAALLSAQGRARAAQCAAAVALLLAVVPAVGFSYLGRWAHSTGSYRGMALHTAFGFVLASIALLDARPRHGSGALWSGSGAGAQPPAQLVGVLVAVVWFSGWAYESARRAGSVGSEPLPVAVLLGQVGVAAALIGVCARRLQREQKKRRLCEERVGALVHAAPFAFVLAGADDKIEEINDEAVRLLGLEGYRVRGRRMQDFLSPRERLQFAREVALRREKGADDPLWRRGVVLRTEPREGSAVVSVESRMTPVGSAGALVHTLRDATEGEQFEEQLSHARKIRAIGELSAGVAHDYNNLAQVIESCTRLLLERFEEGDEGREDLLQIRAASRRGASLARQLLSLARRQVASPRPHSLTEVVRSMERMLRSCVGRGVNLQLKLTPALWSTRIDRGQFEQIVLNLVANACHAMPNGGRLLLETANEKLVGECLGTGREVPPGAYVQFSVSDTGEGIPPEIQRRVFEPFFTTKSRGQGTGLGLACCDQLTRRLGGHIRVSSKVGSGTVVSVYLPRCLGAEENGSQAQEAEPGLPHAVAS